MRTVSGQPVSAGVAIGTLYLYRREKPVISRAAAGTPDEEWTRFRAACIRAGQQLTGLYEQSRDTLGEEAASIFSIHRLMLDDIVYLDAVRALLDNEGVSAAWAAGTAGERLAEMFAAMEDAYMRSRAADVRDVSRRVAEILSGGESAIRLDEPVIVAAEDLSPSEAARPGVPVGRCPHTRFLQQPRGDFSAHAVPARADRRAGGGGLGRLCSRAGRRGRPVAY